MKEFEIISNGGVMADHIQVPAPYEAAVASLFGPVLDMATANSVVAVIDEAKQKLQADPEKYRALLTSDDGLGLRHIRQMLDSMRGLLVTFPDATVSGLVEP
ncbi:hypothetical protein ACFXG4_03510 [Nocardia sp. NPDC059246]|uniref:hypothetical protein n=1 Tax=unclassified Nocardia TaxID=2637762 RepID=UPI003697C0A8